MANWKNREFNKLRKSEDIAWRAVIKNTKFRDELGKLLLTEEDIKCEHPVLGTMLRSYAHPDLMPLILEKVKKLLERKENGS